jgi:3-oxoacyl-[acyl-carrier-protein] synthase II
LRVVRRVVVTGLGAVTPLGLDVESHWQGLLAGRSGVGPVTLFDASRFPCRIAAEVKGFDPTFHMDHRMARRSGRFAQFGTAAARQGLESARLAVDEFNRDQIGVIMASSGGFAGLGPQERILEERGPGRIDPLLISRVGAHMAGVRIGHVLGLRGPNTTINSACASGADAIGHALNLIRLGQAEVLLAGGCEATVAPLTMAAMAIVGALSRRNDDPQAASRPFDAERDGFVMGEGAGVLLLESDEHARSRDAPILAEVAGAGWSFDAVDETAPDVEGQAQAMARALQDAGVAPADIDYINAHGTSTPLNDKTETAAIKKVFGDLAYRIPVSSNKSMIGHLVAAAGAVEAVAAVLTLRDQVLPPTINYRTPDPECDLDYVPNEARPHRVDVCLSNSFGLGGQNVCLVLRRYQGQSPSSK